MNEISVFAIDGIDRTGKNSLIEGIKNKLGFFQVIHFSKPEKLDAYDKSLFEYQYRSFSNSMELFFENAWSKLIFNRWTLGELVYAPLYRNYSGEYIFEIEKHYGLDKIDYLKLILLTEDFSKSKHFIDDGKSLGPSSKREDEQKLFIEAFNRSIIKNKKMICITGSDGQFRPKEEILEEALS